jgi:hypothetical protein
MARLGCTKNNLLGVLDYRSGGMKYGMWNVFYWLRGARLVDGWRVWWRWFGAYTTSWWIFLAMLEGSLTLLYFTLLYLTLYMQRLESSQIENSKSRVKLANYSTLPFPLSSRLSLNTISPPPHPQTCPRKYPQSPPPHTLKTLITHHPPRPHARPSPTTKTPPTNQQHTPPLLHQRHLAIIPNPTHPLKRQQTAPQPLLPPPYTCTTATQHQ